MTTSYESVRKDLRDRELREKFFIFPNLVESHYTLTDQHRWTNSTNFVYAAPNQTAPVTAYLNSVDFERAKVYFEAIITGDSPATCECHLYNETDGAMVVGSTLTSTSSGGAQRERTSELTLTDGIKEYTVKYKRVGGDATNYPSIIIARIIVRYEVLS